jgi:PBP1b-binding outer membrane lipoprotein LpoB
MKKLFIIGALFFASCSSPVVEENLPIQEEDTTVTVEIDSCEVEDNFVLDTITE